MRGMVGVNQIALDLYTLVSRIESRALSINEQRMVSERLLMIVESTCSFTRAGSGSASSLPRSWFDFWIDLYEWGVRNPVPSSFASFSKSALDVLLDRRIVANDCSH